MNHCVSKCPRKNSIFNRITRLKMSKINLDFGIENKFDVCVKIRADVLISLCFKKSKFFQGMSESRKT